MANNLETRLAPLVLALRGGQLSLNDYLEQIGSPIYTGK